MFTGIIEETGIVKEITRGSKSATLRIQATKVLEETHIGDSISTNGICLTVVAQNNNSFTVEVMAETLRKTNLNKLSPGNKVNLERALKLSDRLGGHLVSGHIDGTGIITSIVKEDIARIIKIKTTSELLKYIIPKGSVALDGISLTVVSVADSFFTVSVIPHTASGTTLLRKDIGETVNIETDMIAKYTEQLLFYRENKSTDKEKKGSINMEFLNKNGFY